ncbi:PAS domain-containing protein [Pleurocapsales cyanobacterium LEGE 10410]|nr:PAS domain-containing protein [Pleurocapsales cyanobacterium LEGE 10410]
MNHANLSLVKTEIIKQLGYFPAFLVPALNSSSVAQSLLQQTLLSYLNNPLPALFKEKLFVILSRYVGINYFTICHSCTLRSQGMSAAEILALENIGYPQTETEIAADLQILDTQWSKSSNWQDNPQIEASLLRCANLIFIRPSTNDLSTKLKSFLGIYYHYLIVFLGYVKLSHQWVIDNPDISHQQDRRSQLHLGSLLLEEIRLAQFFQTKVKSEASPKEHSSLSSEPNAKSSTTYVSYPQLKQKAFSACLANAPFPVMIHTQQGQIIYFNRNWLEATGYSLSEISTINQWNQKVRVKRREIVKLAGTSEKLFAEYANLARQTAAETTIILQQIIYSLIDIAPGITEVEAEKKIADAIRSEVTISTSDGAQLFWELYSAPLSLVGSHDELTISIARDTTELVRQETKLAEMEAKLKLVLETTKTEITPHQLDKAGSDRLNEQRPTVWEVGKFRRKYDAETFVSFNIKHLYQEKRHQPSLAWGEKKGYDTGLTLTSLKTVLNLLPYYLFVVDVPTQTISLMNSELAKSLGLADSEAAEGLAIAKCFAPEYANQIVQQHQQVIAHNQALHIQEEVALPDGIHDLNTVVTPLYDKQGNIYALLHTSNRVSDLAATQKALTQRTLQLEAANKELESFSYSVSHDLQAPLRVINGFSQVLWENYQSDLDERGRHYLQRIQVNSKRMSDLIDVLLQLSRVTRTQMKSVKVDLSAIAREIMAELRARDPQRRVELTIAPDLQAKGDPQLLEIALHNLLDNAWKYTSKRSLTKIEFDVLDRADRRSTYYIRDNGAGFDLNYADKLFTPFHRLHSQAEFPGTGIGLATVKRIIYRHGGRIWAKGECDRGATIYFSL